MKKVKFLFIINLFLILNLTSMVFSQVQWEKNFEGDRYFASTILRQDDGTFLVGTGDMKVHKIDASGNYIELFYQLQNNTGSWSSFESSGDNFVGHGGASGYNIFTNIIDANGDQISYNTVSAGGGYSGSGDIIIDEGDIYMAWASNCCGQGQTWDSNVKKFNGLTADISWNTEICFSCDASLGGCSQGLDYPNDISEGHSLLLVSGYITDSPCTNHGYLNVVDKNGTKQWEYTERDFHSVYVKSLPIGVSDFIVSGIKGATNERRMFASKFNSDGEIVWNAIVNTDYEVRTTDMISVNDTTVMLFGISENGIFYATISSSGSILSQQELETENSPMMDDNYTHTQVVKVSETEFVGVYSYGTWYDDTNFAMVNFTFPVTGCTDQYADNYNSNASLDDGSCSGYPDNGEYTLNFDGSNDYVLVNPMTRDASLDLTINVHAKGTGTMTCPKTSAYESYFNYSEDENGNSVYFHLGILTPQSGHGWDVDEDLSSNYNLYTITLDDLGDGSTLAELFINGVTLGQHTYPYSIPSYSFMEIGRNIVEQNGLYDGDISEIQIWDKVLSATEIQSYLGSTPDGNESDLMGLWKFNGGTGQALYDHTGNQNHGTINGASWQLRNQSPVASAITVTTAEDTDFSGSLSGSDADDDALIYAITSNPSNGTVTLNSASAGTFTFSPTANYNGSDTFTFTVNDGTVTSSAATVTITITAVNDNPVASAVTGTTSEDTGFSGSLSGTDVDGDVLTYALASGPSNGNVEISSVNSFLSFDGSDDYVEIPYSNTFNNFTDGLSVAAWIKLDEINGVQTIIENGNEKGFAFLVTPGGGEGELYFNVQNQSGWSSIYGGTPIPINQWHHVALTYSPGSLKLYQNGELIEEGNNASGNIINNDGDLWIGRYHQYENYFNGDIDEVAVWNSLLTSAEIASLYNSGNIVSASVNSGNYVSSSSLKSYWNFNEGSGAALTDQTSNDLNGTIVGATWGESSGSNNTYVYSPNYNYHGSDSFTYTVSDGSATSEEASVSITINSVIDKYYVATTGSDDNNGSLNNPFATIQAGINAAENSDTIFVAAGTYNENITFNGKDIYLKGAAVATTIIDGGQNESVVQFANEESSNTTIQNFTIQNGQASSGGGILISNGSSPNLLNLIIKNNTASQGGGVFVQNESDPTFQDVIIHNNQASPYDGGGIGVYGNCDVVIKNMLLYNNQCDAQGGGIYLSEYASINLISSTISDNVNNGVHTDASANGVSIGVASSFIANSSIIWGNTGGFSQINIPEPQFGGSASITYSNIGGGWFGTGNVNADPYFTDSDNGDFTLEDYSSLIGIGASSVLPATDLAGVARPNPAGSTSDIGAYENENASSQRAMAVQNLDVGGEEDLQHISDHTPLISFDYLDNANQTQTSYQVQVSTESDFSDIDMWDTEEVASSETSTTYAGTELVDGATYHIRAKVSASDFSSGWATTSFRLNSTVAVGNLTFNPEYNESNVYTTVEFPTISSSPSADSESDDLSVKYILSTNSSFTNKVDSSTVEVSSSTASWQPSIDPSDNQQYWVKASTYDGYEYGTETDASTFILNNENDAPDAFTLSSPVLGEEVSTLTPTLDWPDVNDVDPLDVLNYTLYLDTPDPGITTIEVGTASTYEISTSLIDNTTYYWKVKATDAVGLSRENTGGYQSFRVNTENDLPAQFSLLAPENTSMVTDLTPTLLWNEPTDADDRSSRSIDSYSVYIGTDNAFTDVTPIVATSNNYTPSSNLTEDVLYYWKVIATDDDGGETTSTTWSFWTNSENSAPAQFTLTSPEEGDETGLAPTFTWAKSSDADLNDELSYTLSLGSNQLLLSDIVVSEYSSGDNYSLSFDGVNDFVEIEEQSLETSVFEENISLTVKVLVSGGENTDRNILTNAQMSGDGYVLAVTPDNKFKCIIDVTSGWVETVGTSVININQWYSVIATYDGENVNLYVDGVLEGQSITSGEVIDPAENSSFYIGVRQDQNQFFAGKIDDLTIWNITLDQDQILAYNNSAFSSNDPGLVGFWDFNNGSGEVLFDMSGNGNNGTINGASWESNNSNSISYTSATNLTDDTEYHWQVTAEDQSGATYSTPLQSFVVNAENDLPSDFDLLSPSNTTMVTDLTPELHWDEPTDADLLGSIETYDVYISTDNSFADVTPEEVSVNTFTVSTDLTEDALYYWKVVATDDDGGETSSATWSFWTNSINSAPAEFTLVSPEQDEETGLTPTFSWNESNDADLYDEIAYTLSYSTDPTDLTDVTSQEEDNYSLNFDGVDNYVEVAYPNSVTNITDQISYSAWFKVDSELDRQNIFVLIDNFPGHFEGFILRTGSDMSDGSDGGYIYSNFVTNSGSRTVQSPTNDLADNEGEWINATVTYSSAGDLKLFVNGVLKDELNAGGGLIPHQDAMLFGRMNEDLDYHNGKIDKIGIWNRDLTSSEVLEIAQGANFDQLSTGLVAHWNFNEGSGDVLTDQTGNGNNGTINGATWSTDVPSSSSSDVALGTSYTPNQDLTDDTQYHWQVTAVDLSGATFTTPLQSFVVNSENQGPGTFALSYPDNESMVVDLTPTLSWESSIHPDPASYIDEYQVYLSTDDSFESVTADVSNSNSFEISSNLDEDELYYWKIVAVDEGGDETSSSTWSFWTNSVNSAPTEFTLVSPEQDEETGLTPTFSWSESSDEDLYDELAYTLSYGTDPSDLTDVTSSFGESAGENYSLSFDGMDDYVFMDFLSGDVDNSSVTLMGWFKSTSNGLPDIYYEGIMGFRDYPQSDGNFFATMNWTGYNTPTVAMYGGTSVNIPLTPDDGSWYHLALTYDGTYTASFLNGTLINSAIAENDPIVPSIQLLLGNNNENGDHHFKGYIDDVSLWSVALNADEIESYMTGSPSENQNNLVGYWNFNQGSDDVLTDLSGNGNDGVIVGAIWSTDVPETGISGEALSGTSFTPSTDLTDDTEYHWQVTAEDQSGATYTTPLQSFVVNLENDLPSDFDLLSPGNTTMVTDLAPVLHWDEPTDADLLGSIETYSVYISTDNSFADATPEEVSVNTYTVSADLTEDALYYWKVVATDDDGGETASSTWSFWTNSINSTPAEFTLVSPEQDEETGLTPTFSWNESSDADLYDEIAYILSYGIDPSDLTDVTNLHGEDNYSLLFNGSDSYLEFNNIESQGDFSFLGYINFSSANASSNVFINGEGSDFIRLDGSGENWRLGYNSSTGGNHIGDSVLPLNEWVHVAVVRENEVLSFYVDGQLDGTFDEPNNLINFSQVGYRVGSWDGLLDEFSIWGIALSQAEVQQYLENFPASPTDGLLAAWTFDEGEGLVLTDLSGNENNGTLVGPEWSDDVPDMSNSGGALASISYAPSENLLDNTRYHWQVTAEDLSGATYTTPLQSFIVNSENDLPSDFALLSPDNGGMVTDLTPTLHWQEPTDADARNSRSIESYNVYLGTDDSFNNVFSVTVSSNYYEIEFDLDENISYYWKVVAIDDDGGETSSNTWTFWTNNENSSPTEFSLLTPEEGEETILTPTFTWTESTDEDLYDVVGYTLKYGTDPTDLDLVEPFEAGTNINYSLSFDGEDDYILMENFQIPEPYLYDATIELWFKSNIDPQSFSEEGFEGTHLLKKSGLYEEMDLRLFGDSLGFEWESNIFGIQEGTHMLQGAYNDANWHHYAVQISDDVLSVFLDGVNVYEEIVSETAPNFFDFSGPFTNLLIGVNSDQESSFFKGLISEMKISSVAQYSDNFNPDSLRADESTVSLWKFNSNSGDVLYDLSGNENHGAIYGDPTWTTDVPALYGQTGLIVGTSYTTEFDLSDNTRYYWQVTATDLSGATHETEIQSFIVNLENDNPDMFSLLAPENTSMVIDLTPTFYWEVPIDQDDTRSRSIESYFIYYGTGIEDLTVEVVNSNSFTVLEPLIEDTTYFWKVVARDDDGGETQTDTWSFWTNSVNSTPTSFTLLTPEENQDVNLRPTFSWTESTDEDLYDEIGYTIQIGTDPFNLEDVTPPEQIEAENFSVEFDGQDDFIEIAYFNGLDISENYTWMFDVQFYDINSNAMLIENNSFYNNDGYYINYIDSRVWFSLCSEGTCYQYSTTENNFLNDTWYNIQIVKLDGVISIYVDGVNATDEVSYNITPEEDISQYYVANTESLIIGLNTSGDTQPFSGKIDRLALWGMALDEMQVEYYDATSPSGLEEGVIGYWNFNQGDGNIVSDLSGNDNNGTLNGTIWIQEEESDIGQNENITYYLPEADLLDNTEYYWQVTATDHSGATSTAPMQSFFVNSDNDNPIGFTLQSPDSGISIPNTSEILLFWDVTTDIDGDQVNYELYFGNSPETMELVNVVGVNYYEIQGLIEETYFWSVTAYDDLGGSVSSAIWSFDVVSATNNAPVPFSILSPSNGAQSDSLQVELRWEPTTDFDLGDTVSYQVELGENINSLISIYNGPETVFITEQLLDNTTYYWRVLARDLNGASTENNEGIYTFTVNTENDLPSDFALLLPENGAVVTDLTPTFMWEEPTDEDDVLASSGTGLVSFNPNILQMRVGGRPPSFQSDTHGLNFDSGRDSRNSRSVASYDIYISTDSLFINTDPLVVEVNSYTPSENLIEDTTYYWKVLATDDDGGQTESNIQNFITNSQNSAPYDFTLLTPSNGEEADMLPVLFTWTESEDPDANVGDEVTYLLEVGENINDMENIYTGYDTVFTTDQLLDNTNYYWRVLATDLNGAATENMGGIHSFMVNMENDLPDDFMLLFPENGSMVTDLTPTFMWEEPSDEDDAVTSFDMQSSHFSQSTTLQVIKGSFLFTGSGVNRTSTNSRSITSYDLYIGTDGLFTDIDPIVVETNNYTPEEEMLEDMMYFWKIVATDDDGGQTESEVHSFWTNNQNSPPSEITLLTPESDDATGVQPFFSWTESTDGDINDSISYTIAYGSDVISLSYVELDDQLSYYPVNDLTDNTNYFWQVIATDYSGATYTTDFHSFTVNSENDNPEGFSLLSPDSSSVIQSSNQYLIWTPSEDSDGDSIQYEVFLDGQSIGVTSHNYMEASDLFEDATYEWYVVANDNNEGITVSPTWSFTVNGENMPPTPFSLLSPSHESLLTTTNITFNWESSSDVDIHDSVSYQLHIDTGDSSHIIETSDTSFIINNLSDNNIYHWSVKALDANGAITSNTNDQNMFIINIENDIPSVVALMAPIEGSTQSNLTPNFSWTNSYDPDPMDIVSYNLSWWEPFSENIQSVNLDTNGFTPTGYFLDNAIYQWRIQSEDEEGAFSFSDTAYFYTDAFEEPPVNFSTISPIPEANMSSTIINFKWFSTLDPDPNDEILYRIVHTTDWSDTSTYVYTAEIEDTSMSLLLENNVQYFWVAQALDKDGFVVSSNYNTPHTFIIGTLSTEGELIPDEFALHQNFPNPFNPTTTIRYDLPNKEDVSIVIFDVVGRKIRSLVNQYQSPGYHRIQWDAKNDLGEPVSAGMYIYTISAGEHRSVKKMVLLK